MGVTAAGALVACLAVAEHVARHHARVGQPVQRAVDRGERDAMAERGASMDLRAEGWSVAASSTSRTRRHGRVSFAPRCWQSASSAWSPLDEELDRHDQLEASPGWSDGNGGSGWARCSRSSPSWSRLATPVARSMRAASTRPSRLMPEAHVDHAFLALALRVAGIALVALEMPQQQALPGRQRGRRAAPAWRPASAPSHASACSGVACGRSGLRLLRLPRLGLLDRPGLGRGGFRSTRRRRFGQRQHDLGVRGGSRPAAAARPPRARFSSA